MSGTPTHAGSFTFYIKMAEKYEAGVCAGEVTEKRFTIPINAGPGSPPPPTPPPPTPSVPRPNLVIGPDQSGVPPATVGASFALAMTANLSESKTWAIIEGALPSGLTLGASNGVIAGTPTTAGTSSFTVQARLEDGRSDSKALSITVREALVVRTPATNADGLGPAEVGVDFSAPLTASGGFGTYVWSVAAGGLPPGLALGATGTIAGRPTTAGRFGFTILVTDAEGRSATSGVLLRVAARLVVATQLIRRARVGRLYTQNLKTRGGVNPKTWGLKTRRLPRGIRLDPATGVFTGRPRQAGTYRVTVEVSDALGAKATQVLTLVVLR